MCLSLLAMSMWPTHLVHNGGNTSQQHLRMRRRCYKSVMSHPASDKDHVPVTTLPKISNLLLSVLTSAAPAVY